MGTFERVCEIICKRLEISDDKIFADTTWEELGADSIDLVDLITEFEDEFEIRIPDDSVEDIKTVSDMANLIDSL